MNKFEENWHMHFVPECFFDTVLLKKLLQTNKRLIHRKGCNNVVNDLNSKRLIELFAVGIIDKDKRELDYLKRCIVLYEANNIILWKHKERLQFVIQLNPPIENWVITILNESGLRIEDFGYSRNFKTFKKQIKDDIDYENDNRLNNLVNAVIKTDCETIKKMKSFLLYLKAKNYQTDINELING